MKLNDRVSGFIRSEAIMTRGQEGRRDDGLDRQRRAQRNFRLDLDASLLTIHSGLSQQQLGFKTEAALGYVDGRYGDLDEILDVLVQIFFFGVASFFLPESRLDLFGAEAEQA